MTPRRTRVYDDSDLIGFVSLDDASATLIAQACTRGDLAATSLYQLRDGQFVLHEWDCDDPSRSRHGQRLRPYEAAEWLERHDFDVPADLEKYLGPDLASGAASTKPPAASDWFIHVRTADEGRRTQKYADALMIGQPEKRREAIKKRLERLRTAYPDGSGFWFEQANPSSRTSRYLYNAADPRVRDAVSRI